MTTWWHTERLAAVRAALEGVESLVDLGCGSGDLLIPLAQEGRIARLAGLEADADALVRARARLAGLPEAAQARVTLAEGSLLAPPPALCGFDAAAMVEVLEHLDPSRLSVMEEAVFGRIDPRLLVLTTPNAEFNALLGVPPGRMRHPGHRFEWNRAKFRSWAKGAAARWGRGVAFHDVGGAHPELGGSSQMAVFRRDQPSE